MVAPTVSEEDCRAGAPSPADAWRTDSTPVLQASFGTVIDPGAAYGLPDNAFRRLRLPGRRQQSAPDPLERGEPPEPRYSPPDRTPVSCPEWGQYRPPAPAPRPAPIATACSLSPEQSLRSWRRVPDSSGSSRPGNGDCGGGNRSPADPRTS